MIYNITDKVKEAWQYYDKMLDIKLSNISKLSGVDIEKLKKINPAEFIEKNKYQQIDNYTYKKIKDWIEENKTDDNYLISPCDADEETANQISYKEQIINKCIRASKCKVVPIPSIIAKAFFIKNHRQSLPLLRGTAISYALVYNSKIVAVMTYDKSNSAVRGGLEYYELLRLAIAHGYKIHGGASKLQKSCESSLILKGEEQILSYSNATINNGNVYKALGFEDMGLDGGQPFVILRNFKIERLINLYPNSTNRLLAKYGRIKTHLGGNKTWIKTLDKNSVLTNK